jgi:hypothetical protein
MISEQQVVKHVADAGAASVTVAAFVGWLPTISALLGIVWFGIQITEKVAGKPFNEILLAVWRKLRSQ